MNFKLNSEFTPTGDQPQAINTLVRGLNEKLKYQTLLGVTGSGKTFTMAKVIEKLNRPTLIISHNKTLAAQLYQEFKQFFPQNAVSYFVSYYDFYQPEAYIPQTDTYIEKETEVNEEIDKLRLASTTNLLTRPDTLVVASVSCIYNLGDPRNYGKFIIPVKVGQKITRGEITKSLIELQYDRSEFGQDRATFRVRGDSIDVFLAYEDSVIRIGIDLNEVKSIEKIDNLTGKLISAFDEFVIYPAKHYLTETRSRQEIFEQIRSDLSKRIEYFKKNNKLIEAQRLSQKVNFDLEMIEEMGYVNGIENYSRYFDARLPGEPPFTLLDYFKKPYGSNWLLFIDESHMTVPQLHGMYNGDRSRKQTLIDFGFRLPAAIDNRPLKFEEFMERVPQIVYVSATPSSWELSISKNVAEQLIRPTGILDPKIYIRPTRNQLIDLIREIIDRKKNGQRVLVTTLTKKMAEDLSEFMETERYKKLPEFKDLNASETPKVQYLHSDIVTLERSDILDDLRLGRYDAIIGINLLREGLDLPEVSLVAILDADKEGFLRSQTSLVQTMGRAARHIDGVVIMYADTVTDSMKNAIKEIDRRRRKQEEYNTKHKIEAKNIIKPIRDKLVAKKEGQEQFFDKIFEKKSSYENILKVESDSLTPLDAKKLIKKLEKEMRASASELNFELAAAIRDKINELRKI